MATSVTADSSRSAGSVAGWQTLAFPALGTNCVVRFRADQPAQAVEFERAVRGWVGNFEARYSRFRPDSLVSRINAAAGTAWVAVDAEMEQMLDVCQSVFALTEGIVDATAGPLLQLWNYKQPPAELPDLARIAAARSLVGWYRVQRSPGRVFLPQRGMALDFGGWGKEWAVDAVAELATVAGIRAALIDFGHDVRGLGAPAGRPAWHVGLEDPTRPGVHSGSVALFGDRGVASSGDYIRNFVRDGRRYGHIVDPRSGTPVHNGVLQVTVVAGTCFEAGLLSTAAFVLGPAAGLDFLRRFPGAEGLLVTSTGRVQTRGFWNYVVT